MTNLSLTSFGLGFPAQHPRVKTTLSTGKRQQKLLKLCTDPGCTCFEASVNIPVLDGKGGWVLGLLVGFLSPLASNQPGFLRFRVRLLGGLGVSFGIRGCFPMHKVTKFNSSPAVEGGSRLPGQEPYVMRVGEASNPSGMPRGKSCWTANK